MLLFIAIAYCLLLLFNLLGEIIKNNLTQRIIVIFIAAIESSWCHPIYKDIKVNKDFSGEGQIIQGITLYLQPLRN